MNKSFFILSEVQKSRPDVTWLGGPSPEGAYEWDSSLPNQAQIQILIEQASASYSVSTVPESVTPRQMRIALVMSGISLSTIEAIIDSLPEPQKSVTKITWEYSVEFQRKNPILIAMAPALGFNSQQLDQLFTLASTL